MSIATAAKAVGKFVVKHSPTILLTVGLVSVTAGTGLAIKGSFRVKEELDKYKLNRDSMLNIIHNAEIESEVPAANPERLMYNEICLERIETNTALLRTTRKDFRKLCIKTYAPPAVLFLAGVGAIIFGHRIMIARYAALAVAYTALAAEYDEYRALTAMEIGDEKAAQLKIQAVETTQAKITIDPKALYGRWFGPGCYGWEESFLWRTLEHLKNLENMCNMTLQANGHLFLSEVYKLLDPHGSVYPITNASRQAGWVLPADGIPNVSFRLEPYYQMIKDNGSQHPFRQIFLDFNVRPILGPDPFAIVGKECESA